LIVFAILGAVSLLIWFGIRFHPACPWDFQPVGEDEPLPPAPAVWPHVWVLVPARNESETLPQTLPPLLTQDYPGELAVMVIDDRSQDGTANIARKVATEVGAESRLTVISGTDLPAGWVGKVWALEQGAAYCGLPSRHTKLLSSPQSAVRTPRYFLLTDADIRHTPQSLRRLVCESEAGHLALNSRMARLRCVSAPERLLIPPFVFFFNLLYPMRQVNDRKSPVAAAAGGCVLLASSALARIGGFACIKDKIIDDVSLARQVKGLNEPIRLALSRSDVQSLRIYESLGAIWMMVRRTAFTELRCSWIRLTGTVVGLTLMFLIPPLYCVSGLVLVFSSGVGVFTLSIWWVLAIASLGLLAWIVMASVYLPAVRFFNLSRANAWTLPLAGLLYGAMTTDSALRYVSGKRTEWRDRARRVEQ
jgi:hopene-associated glycosyltransferase HpnB